MPFFSDDFQSGDKIRCLMSTTNIKYMMKIQKNFNDSSNIHFLDKNKEIIPNITKTRLFKYTENLTTKK